MIKYAASSETFLDCFDTQSEKESQLAVLYKGFALACIEPEEEIRIYESLLRVPNAADDLKLFDEIDLGILSKLLIVLKLGDKATGSSFLDSLQNKQQAVICYILVIYDI